jgi:hypothetical protein
MAAKSLCVEFETAVKDRKAGNNKESYERCQRILTTPRNEWLENEKWTANEERILTLGVFEEIAVTAWYCNQKEKGQAAAERCLEFPEKVGFAFQCLAFYTTSPPISVRKSLPNGLDSTDFVPCNPSICPIEGDGNAKFAVVVRHINWIDGSLRGPTAASGVLQNRNVILFLDAKLNTIEQAELIDEDRPTKPTKWVGLEHARLFHATSDSLRMLCTIYDHDGGSVPQVAFATAKRDTKSQTRSSVAETVPAEDRGLRADPGVSMEVLENESDDEDDEDPVEALPPEAPSAPSEGVGTNKEEEGRKVWKAHVTPLARQHADGEAHERHWYPFPSNAKCAVKGIEQTQRPDQKDQAHPPEDLLAVRRLRPFTLISISDSKVRTVAEESSTLTCDISLPVTVNTAGEVECGFKFDTRGQTKEWIAGKSEGGAGPINWIDETGVQGFLMLARESHESVYYHRFLFFDRAMTLCGKSLLFFFLKRQSEVTCGMAATADGILVGLGSQDREAELVGITRVDVYLRMRPVMGPALVGPQEPRPITTTSPVDEKSSDTKTTADSKSAADQKSEVKTKKNQVGSWTATEAAPAGSTRAALLLTGETRTLLAAAPFIWKNLIQVNAAHVFIFAEVRDYGKEEPGDIELSTFDRLWPGGHVRSVRLIGEREQAAYARWFEVVWNDKAGVSEEVMKKSGVNREYLRRSGTVREYYDIGKCAELMYLEEAKNGQRYDVVIRSRLDAFTLEPIRIAAFFEGDWTSFVKYVKGGSNRDEYLERGRRWIQSLGFNRILPDREEDAKEVALPSLQADVEEEEKAKATLHSDSSWLAELNSEIINRTKTNVILFELVNDITNPERCDCPTLAPMHKSMLRSLIEELRAIWAFRRNVLWVAKRQDAVLMLQLASTFGDHEPIDENDKWSWNSEGQFAAQARRHGLLHIDYHSSLQERAMVSKSLNAQLISPDAPSRLAFGVLRPSSYPHFTLP